MPRLMAMDGGLAAQSWAALRPEPLRALETSK